MDYIREASWRSGILTGLAYGGKKADIYTGSLMTSYKMNNKLATFEPEIFLNANKNYDNQWNEIGGGDFNLRYENYDDFFLRSRLSVKISPPIAAEETTEFLLTCVLVGLLTGTPTIAMWKFKISTTATEHPSHQSKAPERTQH